MFLLSEDEAFYDLATPKYDVIDFSARAARGGDGAPPPKAEKISHAASSTPGSKAAVVEVADAAAAEAAIHGPENAGKVVVLDFSAGWCKNCKKIAPTIQQLAQAHAASAAVYAVDIDELAEVAVAHDVSTLPRLLLFRDGTKVGDYLGSNAEEIKALFEATCSSNT